MTRKSPESSCQKFASCDESVDYVGSHGVLVFCVSANFAKEMLAGLNFGKNRTGLEKY